MYSRWKGIGGTLLVKHIYIAKVLLQKFALRHQQNKEVITDLI